MIIFSLNERRGLTLTELIIASALLAMVILAIGGISISSRYALVWTNNKAMSASKAGIGMDHMVRNLRIANRVEVRSGPNDPSWEIWAWIDRDNTPADPTDDAEIRYIRHVDPASRKSSLRYGDPPDVNEQDLVWGVTSFEPKFDNENEPFYLTIELGLKGDPAVPVDPKKNPEVRLRSGVNARCMDRVEGL